MAERTGSRNGRVHLAVLLLVVLVQLGVHSNEAKDRVDTTIPQGKYPFMVSVNDRCTGAIISSHHVLTSAHCALSTPSGGGRSFVRIDAHDVTDPEDGRKILLKQKIIHEYYTRPTGRYTSDLAIIVLKEAISDPTHIVSLPGRIYRGPTINDQVKAIGWQQAPGEGCTPVPHQYDLQVITSQACEIFPDQNNVCVAMGPGPRPCNSNCGGLLIKRTWFSVDVLIGIATFNPDLECNEDYNPRLYTLLTQRNREWIERKIRPYSGLASDDTTPETDN